MITTTRRMIKTPTGVRYSPKQFRKLNTCLICGRASRIKKESRCPSCIAENLKDCEVCGIILRSGVKTYYLYDIRAEHREGVNFKASKEYVIEFSYEREPFYEKFTDTLCRQCFGWQLRIKYICMTCNLPFKNTEENYKLNGNQCGDCAGILEMQELSGSPYSLGVSVKSLK